MEPNLLMICLSSFIGVTIILGSLSAIIQIIMKTFAEKEVASGPDDSAVHAAIVSAYARMYPGTQISKIEEEKNTK